MEAEDLDGLTELCLAGQDLTELSLLEYGSSIRKIDLSYNILMSLRGLHVCADTLEELILDNNMLERLDFRAQFPNLHTLSLNKNKISDMGNLILELKSRVANLRHISLLGNPVCPDRLSYDSVDEKDYQQYRYYILHHLPNVRFIDSRPVLFAELKESRKPVYGSIKIRSAYTPLTYAVGREISEAAFQRQASSSLPYPRQSTASVKNRTRNGHRNSYPAPIPSPGSSGSASGSPSGSSQLPYQPKGKVGKRRFRYVGKHSEGNRFIMDSDL